MFNVYKKNTQTNTNQKLLNHRDGIFIAFLGSNNLNVKGLGTALKSFYLDVRPVQQTKTYLALLGFDDRIYEWCSYLLYCTALCLSTL